MATISGWKWNVENLWRWITDHETSPAVHAVVQGNATPTTVSASNTHYKAVGTILMNPVSRSFSVTNGQLTNLGEHGYTFDVSASIGVTSGNNQTIGIHLAKNGVVQNYTETLSTTSGSGKAENIGLKTFVQLEPNEYVEIWLENKTSATNITMNSASIVMKII
jgi:hypothetical protein